MGNVLKRFNGSKWEAVGGTVTGDTLPIGSMVEYGGNVDPSNWLICDGRAISRLLYADLFNVIGTTYGEGDGSTTFNIPDYRGKGPVGLNSDDTDFNFIGKVGGEKEHTLTINEIPSHNHGVSTSGSTGIDSGYSFVDNGGYTSAFVQATGGGQAHNNMHPYIVQNFIIKAYQSVGVVGSILNNKSNSTTDTYSCDYQNKIFEGEVLYSNSSGTASNITLSKNPLEYDKIIIYGGDGNYGLVSTTIFTSENVNFQLHIGEVGSKWFSIIAMQGTLTALGVTITNEFAYGQNGYTTSTDLKIKKIVGYKL